MNQYIAPRSKLYGHLDRIDAIKHGGRPAPVNVEIDLSNRCSLGCSWCHFAYTHTRGPLAGTTSKPAGHIDGGDLMDVDFALEMLRQLAVVGVKSVTFTGGGEPTLHQHFDRIVASANAYGLHVGLYTHGGHISAERAALLKRYCTFVFVSLDECAPETYKASKGVDRFQAATDGIRRLVAAEGKATIGIGFFLHKDNFHQVREMVKLGRALGVDYVQFRPTIRYEQDAPGELAEDTKWISWAVGYLNEFRGDSFVVADIDRFRMYQEWNGHGYSTCYWSAMQTVITPNGKVWRCTNKREHPEALLGDMTVDDFATIWARSGGPCAVDAACRLFCRGHLANLELQPMMVEMPHANFI
jgi:MoaA/NifB/PqqE/SkfB family radical SAM enzyme